MPGLARTAYNLLLWPVAGLLRLLARRSPTRWVFAGCGGTRFADNAAWLFLWAARERPDLRVSWITRSPSIARRLRGAGLPVALEWSPRGLWRQARAGVCVVSHGPGDLFYPAAARSYVANLWHGLPIKHIMLDHPSDFAIMRPASAWGRLVQHLRRPGLLRGPDLLLAMTPAGRRRMEQCSGLPPERTSDAGFPRLQALTDRTPDWPFPGDVEEAAGLRAGKSLLVLFLPTWGTDEAQRRALLGPMLVQWLERNDAVLVLKTHPDDPVMAEDPAWRSRIAVARRTLDAMVLMRQADILITDVSSALVDMLAAGKPALVIRTAWDWEVRDQYQTPESFLTIPPADDEAALCRALGVAAKARRAGRSTASTEAQKWLGKDADTACERVLAEIEARRRPWARKGRGP